MCCSRLIWFYLFGSIQTYCMKVFAFLDKASNLVMTVEEFAFALLPNYIEYAAYFRIFNGKWYYFSHYQLISH